ncbi:hypothetical protein [Paenibacillus sp. Soil766]|uniref:hypothetical protein n=1 Tax=Paenibacillus sp. Soil766 TaxID=1736404 RepID=UPI001F37533B|nr:hypothetical protein [Paenibacillus sp. Soil766]
MSIPVFGEIENVLSFVFPGYLLFVAACVVTVIGARMIVVTTLEDAAKITAEGKQASSIASVVMGFASFNQIGCECSVCSIGRLQIDPELLGKRIRY